MANSAVIAAIILLFSVMLMNAYDYEDEIDQLRKIRDEIRIDIHKVFMNNSKMPVTNYNRRSSLLMDSQLLRDTFQLLMENDPNADSDLDKEAQRKTETILRTMLLDGGSHLTVMKCFDKYVPKIIPYADDSSFANILDNLIPYRYDKLHKIVCPTFKKVDKKEIGFNEVKEAFGKVITLDTINFEIEIKKTIELLTLMKLHPDLLKRSQMIIENKINAFDRYLSNINQTILLHVSWINAPLVRTDWDIVAFWSQCGATNGIFFSPTKIVLNVPVGVMINLLATKFNVNCMKNLGTVSTKCEN